MVLMQSKSGFELGCVYVILYNNPTQTSMKEELQPNPKGGEDWRKRGFCFFLFYYCFIMVLVELVGVVCFCFALQNILHTFFCFLYVFCFFLFCFFLFFLCFFVFFGVFWWFFDTFFDFCFTGSELVFLMFFGGFLILFFNFNLIYFFF